MKIPKIIYVAALAFAGCNSTSTEDVKKIKDLAKEDSIRAVQATQKDSVLTTYLNDLNEIQENLDRIKAREKILSSTTPEMKESVVDEVKQLDLWIVQNDKKMNSLQAKLKKMTGQNNNLEGIVAHLTQEIADKDREIADLQAKLSVANDSVRFLTSRFNDSIVEIKKQRAQVSAMRTEMNTVYYVTGTLKQLEVLEVIDSKGGIIGVGSHPQEASNLDNYMFTRSDLSKLKGIALNGKFRRMLTTHPDNTYKIVSGTNADSLIITTPTTFWSESKYLIVAIK